MGLQRTVTCPAPLPPWPAVLAHLSEVGLPVLMRMIDGQPAFPDEAPPDDWRELRVAVPAGMFTLRRQPRGVAVVVWGNADESLQSAAAALAQALADLTGGHIESDD
jgi:hypothetical protein